MTRMAGTARMLHLILEVLLHFRAASREDSGETAGTGDSGNEFCGGRGEGGGVNIRWKDRGGVRNVGDGRSQLEDVHCGEWRGMHRGGEYGKHKPRGWGEGRRQGRSEVA